MILIADCHQKIDIAPHNPDNRPPWAEVPKDSTPKCDTNKYSKVDQKLFGGLYPAFCRAVKGNGEDKPLKKQLTKDDYQPPSTSKRSRSLHPRAPPVNPDQYIYYAFNFEWTGKTEGSQECFKACDNAFDAIDASPSEWQLAFFPLRGMTSLSSTPCLCFLILRLKTVLQVALQA